jgi:hypothetical protein
MTLWFEASSWGGLGSIIEVKKILGHLEIRKWRRFNPITRVMKILGKLEARKWKGLSSITEPTINPWEIVSIDCFVGLFPKSIWFNFWH